MFKRCASGWVGGCARAVVMTVTHLPGENNDSVTLYAIFVLREIIAIDGESTDFLQFFHITHSVAESSLTTRSCRRGVWRRRSPVQHGWDSYVKHIFVMRYFIQFRLSTQLYLTIIDYLITYLYMKVRRLEAFQLVI